MRARTSLAPVILVASVCLLVWKVDNLWETCHSIRRVGEERNCQFIQTTNLDALQRKAIIEGAHTKEVTVASKEPPNVSEDIYDFFSRRSSPSCV
ncbi:hypothetical protein MRX96_026666 [Rhipicephalus microplus]